MTVEPPSMPGTTVVDGVGTRLVLGVSPVGDEELVEAGLVVAVLDDDGATDDDVAVDDVGAVVAVVLVLVVVDVDVGTDDPDWATVGAVVGSGAVVGVAVDAERAGPATNTRATAATATTTTRGTAVVDRRGSRLRWRAWARLESREPPMTLWPSAPGEGP